MSAENGSPTTTVRTSAIMLVTILEYSSESWTLRENYHLNPRNILSLPEKCYIFVDKKSYPESERGRADLLHDFNVPEIMCSNTCTELNGYFGCRGKYNERAMLESYSTWFRCLVKMIHEIDPEIQADKVENTQANLPENKAKIGYVWYEMGFFTCWDHSGRCRIMCVDTPKELQLGLENVLRKKSFPINFGDPFVLHVPLIDQIILQYDVSVWRVRNPVRNIEKAREYISGKATRGATEKDKQNNRLGPLPDFTALHEISRHVIHVSEVLSVTIQTIEGIQRQQKAIYGSLSSGLGKTYKEQVQEYLSFQLQMVKNLQLLSVSNHERLKNEINLAYNMIIRQDNAVVKTIALLTMTFLPATFISALFSTTFFTFDDSGWQTSKKLWLYFIITIPSTILILLVWRLWLYGSVQTFGTSSSRKNFFRKTPRMEPKGNGLSV